MLKKVSFITAEKVRGHIKSVSAWLERCVILKPFSTWLVRGVLKNGTFSMSGKRNGNKVSFTMARKGWTY